MKIEDINQQAVAAYLAKVRNDKHQESGDTHSEGAAKQQAATDKVELSSYIPVTSRAGDEQDTRPNRIEELKSQISDGSYQIPGISVAEKMMSNIVKASLS
jgi:negative regulator of flagellin synthesis FlgM